VDLRGRRLAPSASTMIQSKTADTKTRITSGKKIAGFLKTNQNINQIIITSLKAKTAVKDFFTL